MGGFFEQRMRKQVEDIQRRAAEVADAVSSEVGKEADEYAFKIMKPVARDAIVNAYQEATAHWYDAYVPKKYKRSEDLYNALRFTNPGNDGIGWLFEDAGMNKPSWKPKGHRYNIYGLVFEGGAHGGPVHGNPPPVSTPIPDMFDTQMEDVQQWIQEGIDEAGQAYFEEHFGERFQRRFII